MVVAGSLDQLAATLLELYFLQQTLSTADILTQSQNNPCLHPFVSSVHARDSGAGKVRTEVLTEAHYKPKENRLLLIAEVSVAN